MAMFSRTDRSFLGEWWWTVDRPMLSAFLVLIVFGIVLVTTASAPVAEHLGLWHYHFLLRHLMFLVPSLMLLFGMSFLDKRMVWRLGTVGFVLCVLAMIFVLSFGVEIKGAQRWLHVFGFSIQPSEFIKPLFLIVSAWLMSLQKTKGLQRGNFVAAGLYGFVIALLLLQPDLGMTVIVTLSWAAQIFLAGLPFRYMLGFLMIAVVGLCMAYMSFDHVQSRIDRFLDPDSGDNFQVEKSIEAFQSGGVLGQGPGQGHVKLYLPDAHADFIFSVAGEELGLVFVLAIMGIFTFILYRGFQRIMDDEDIFAVLAVGGLLTMFGLQALVHMGSSLNLLPAKGMTLPFISYGGSSLVAIGFAMGVVLALTRGRKKAGISKGGLSLLQFGS
ncbi:MAG: putative peptidoglycan glycosyltransferase FtsW [Pseudomonadota bacterium]